MVRSAFCILHILVFNQLFRDDRELGDFAGDLVGILEKASVERPEWMEPLEDLLIIYQKCAKISADEFWVKCEGKNICTCESEVTCCSLLKMMRVGKISCWSSQSRSIATFLKRHQRF
ncbi:hypothetical protein KSP39_PZI007572 [Platanthera zijinensis]|uniref:IREH1/IRE-like N-terminal domain-containing protein n=1 Tax=Platanthera zijinensis TaxID=2320716 RepID=A0AAP0BP35_9ASPA